MNKFCEELARESERRIHIALDEAKEIGIAAGRELGRADAIQDAKREARKYQDEIISDTKAATRATMDVEVQEAQNIARHEERERAMVQIVAMREKHAAEISDVRTQAFELGYKAGAEAAVQTQE